MAALTTVVSSYSTQSTSTTCSQSKGQGNGAGISDSCYPTNARARATLLRHAVPVPVAECRTLEMGWWKESQGKGRFKSPQPTTVL